MLHPNAATKATRGHRRLPASHECVPCVAQRFPQKKWYYIVGDDTYLNVDYALQMLEPFDDSQDLWISPSRYGPLAVPKGVSTSSYTRWNMRTANGSRGGRMHVRVRAFIGRGRSYTSERLVRMLQEVKSDVLRVPLPCLHELCVSIVE